MLRPLITKVGSKPLQGFFRPSFYRSAPLTSSLFIAPVAKRFATHQAATRIGAPPSQATNWPKIIGQLGIIGGTVVGLNLFFNRETREGGIPAVEQEYLHETFKYVGAGLGITALAATENVRLVDMYAAIPTTAVGSDGLHLKAQGYDLMAAEWLKAIIATMEAAISVVASSVMTQTRSSG